MSTLLLPLPPSVNHYWRHVLIKGKPRVLISAEGRKYKKLVEKVAPIHKPEYHETGRLAIHGVFHMARLGTDLDNRVKPLLDALHGICYRDDVQVEHTNFIRALDRENPRVELWVDRIDLGPEEYLKHWREKY